MIDTNKIISSFGHPSTEFILYPGCEYLFVELIPCIFKGRIIESGNALIQFIKDNTEHEVPISNLSPIPLTITYFDHIQNESAVPIGTATKEWYYRDASPSYKIQWNGQYFTYSDPTIEKNHHAPLPITYLSDLQAIRSSYLS